jgi:hypothetical protein
MNQGPEAAVFFIKLGNDGKPIKSTNFVSTPDVSDILDIQCTLGSTGQAGRFAIRINNENSKYFIADNIEGEIMSMKTGNPTVMIDQLTGQIEALNEKLSYQPAKVIWKDGNDFLRRKEYNRFYGVDQPEKDTDGKTFDGVADYVYILFETEALNETTKEKEFRLAYRKVPREIAESGDFSGVISTSSGDQDLSVGAIKLEEVILSKEETDAIMSAARDNMALFTEFGGQQEHGRCTFAPMQLCIILMTPRFNRIEAKDALCVAFTGLVDSVSDDFDGTRNIITIIGSDITKWLRITQANVNPAWLEKGLPNGGEFRIFGNIFSGLLGWQIIQLLCIGGTDSEGNPIYGAGNFELVKLVSSSPDHYKNFSEFSSWGDDGIFKYSALGSGMGISNSSDQLFFSGRSVHLQVLPWDSAPPGSETQNLGVYKKIFGPSFGNWQNEYATHFDIGTEVAKLTNYEFYADQYGDIFYHQPRYNNYHILAAKHPEVYILNDEDIINHQFNESDEGVVTSCYCVGQYDYITSAPQLLKYTGFYEDPSLVRKYGRRMVSVSHPYVMTAPDCLMFAKSYLIRANAARFTGTVTIVGRPEIRMHMPVYVPTRNRIYYISGISHSFSYGERFTTTLKLTYGRKPWEYVSEVLNYSVMPNLDASVIYTQSGEFKDLMDAAKENAVATEADLTAIPPRYRLYYNQYDEWANQQRTVLKVKESEITWDRFKIAHDVPPDIPPPPKPPTTL